MGLIYEPAMPAHTTAANSIAAALTAKSFMPFLNIKPRFFPESLF
jgi:hypothetical protein